MAEELGQSKAQTLASPEKDFRRWSIEIRLALKREREWRKTAEGILNKYRGKPSKKNSFNILWANTEVLRPALYNSTPKPDVRRRFRQNDKLGKAVAEVMERSLSYCVDAYDLDNCLRNDVLDSLLPGRATSRIRYIPKFKDVENAPAAAATAGQPAAPASRIKAGFFPTKVEQPEGAAEGEAFEGDHEEVEYEQAMCDHVQWDDFLHGPGKTWDEVSWVAFRCRLTKDDQIEKFGEEIADQITLGDVAEPDLEGEQNRDIAGVFKRSEFWEIWDKDGQRVFFWNESYRKGLLYPKTDGEPGTPPLALKNFFPCPRPLMLVEDTGTLLPTPLFELYKEQAEELDRLSSRINKIVNACRVRFVHDPTLTELKTLMDAGDNEGIPAEQARAWMTNGGIEKAIWWMPIDTVAAVLRELYVARDSAKQVIYEITGLSDVVRGSSMGPAKTATEQKLKANSASLRLQRMQREVQRYVRDMIRLLAEVIGEHFEPKTLEQMTGLKFPTAQEKQLMQLQLQGMQQQAQAAPQQQQGQPGQPQQGQPQPQPQQSPQALQQLQDALSMPSWEDIMSVLRSDIQREYRVDVETDSTVAQSLQQDTEGLREVLGGIVEFMNGIGPAVQAGFVSVDAAKAIVLTVARRTRMGLEVEDALETGIQQPKPQQQPQDNSHLVEAEKTKQAQISEQADAQRTQAKEQADMQRDQVDKAHALQMDAQAKSAELEKHRIETEAKYSFEQWKVEQDNNAKIEVARIQASATLEKSRVDAEKAANDADNEAVTNPENEAPRRKRPLDTLRDSIGAQAQSMTDMHSQLMQAVQGLAEAHAKPKKAKILRDPSTGKAVGIETVAG